jgi:HlyD family secretion protein
MMKSAAERESVLPPTRWIVVTIALFAVVLGGWIVVKYATEAQDLATSLVGRIRGPVLPAGFASGNGRIEATEYDIATKRPGRIAAVAVREGDMVEPGQVLARMDTRDLEADLHEAEAQSAQAREDRRRALAAVTQRQSEVKSASAGIAQRQSDRRRAEATVAQRTSGVDRSQAMVAQRESELALARKELQRSQSLFDGNLIARQKLDEDLTRTETAVAALAGRTVIGAEGRIILDAAPYLVIPAAVSFVAPRAQFTPKEVETRAEREKLMFRVKVRIDPELLAWNSEKVKTGLPGVAYVRLDPRADWPERLRVKLTR